MQKRKLDKGVLIGYFSNRKNAGEALRKLQARGFHRTALVYKNVEGKVHLKDPFPRRRTISVILMAILMGGITGTILFFYPNSKFISDDNISNLGFIIIGGLIGALLGPVLIRRSKYGVDRKLLKDHARWLLSKETVLILQESVEKLRISVALFREIGGRPPAVFILHPKLEIQDDRMPKSRDQLSFADIREHAHRLAAEHQINPNPQRNTELIDRLDQASQWIHQVWSDLYDATRLDKKISPIAEWVLDNEYIIEGNSNDVKQNLPRRYYQELPQLSSGPYRGLPRIYSLAKELVNHTDMRLDRENIHVFIEAYQSEQTLTIGELWGIPQMLRIVLIESIRDLAVRALIELREREIADFWSNRLISANRRNPNQLFSILSELAEKYPKPSPYFGSQIIDHLYDEAPVLVPVQIWLERTLLKSISELTIREQNRQAKDQISIGNGFISLKQLAMLDWRKIFERHSHVEKLLRQDPSDVYQKMDFKTRNQYRQVIEELSRRSGQSEEYVSQQSIELTKQALKKTPGDNRMSHVGAYLVGEGKTELVRLLRCREAPRIRILEWIFRYHSAVYFLGFSTIFALLVCLVFELGLQGQSLLIQLLIFLLMLIPVSQLSLEVLNYMITRLIPPRILSKMDFSVSGIPDAYQTLVVVPMQLENEETILEEVNKLEVRYLANSESNLMFGLFSDYSDSDQEQHGEDKRLLQIITDQIEVLNQRYGHDLFFLFHRDRKWSESENKFIGWERKRGKLEELNRLIEGTQSEDDENIVYVGNPDHLSDVRFIITLDSDTQLPHDSARRMIETLAHPLNQPRINNEGRVLAGSYSLIQPRVSPSLPSSNASLFSRLFADGKGIDPYTKAVSDVYQDLIGEGSYLGKGIYDVRAFNQILSGRFPDELLLSHDLLEGAYIRVGLASDIELFDEFPQNYMSYSRRQHRWIRGDWQIADWILPHVPNPGGEREPNQLSWFNRWKVFNNLRRSLIPISSLGFLSVSWLTSSQIGWLSTIVVAMQIFFHSLVQPVTSFTTRRGLKNLSFSQLFHDFLRAIVDAALIPHQAWLAIDAIFRVWFRRLISHRNLLQWTSQQVTNLSSSDQIPRFILSMGLVSLFSGILGLMVQKWMPSNLAIAVPWLVLWFLSPLFGWLLNLSPKMSKKQSVLPAKDMRFLRQVARRTWRYFSDFVNDKTSWLPPDNYQVSHKNQLAMRTSPTNIGLWLLSLISAHEFGYQTLDQIIEKLMHTFDTISKLDRHKGHLLNWYDIQTLLPLEPRYVSAVDSGNLLGTLLTLEQGLKELIHSPLLDKKSIKGLRDTSEVLRHSSAIEGNDGIDNNVFGELIEKLDNPPDRITGVINLLKRMEGITRVLVNEVSMSSGPETEAVYWARQMEQHVTSWLDISDRYLIWIDILNEKTEVEITQLGMDVMLAVRKDLVRAPTLYDLANGEIGSIQALKSIREFSPTDDISMYEWLQRLMEAYEQSKWLAGEMLGLGEEILQKIQQLSESINMRFLYDLERKLFSIGYNVTESRLDDAYYDLLASEARLGSFVAIARGDVPVEHWFSMGRPYNVIGRRRVLLSWTGTMFEYLMPLIFQRLTENSLLDKAVKEAVEIQIEYGRKRLIPWGISEAAYSDLDLNKTYQYKAFGVPGLGLKRGLEDDLVVAPYATLMAVNLAPKRTITNLKRLESLGLFSDYGYYEAMDFNRRPGREAEDGVIVRTYMAHHQGMGFLSITNFFHDQLLQRYFHADVHVRAVEELLHERVPTDPPIHYVTTRDRTTSVTSIAEAAPSVSKFDTPHTTTPKTQLLSNGRYGLMVTNSGGGYSRWGDFEITRWRADRTQDSLGTFCYIHEVDSDRLWSTAYHPRGGEVEGYSVNFALDRAIFKRTDYGIQSETAVIVSPEEDVEIRRITLVNQSSSTRHLNLTSYIELSMAPHDADRQHPAFNKMFIQTEAVPEYNALLGFRRSRKEDEAPIFIAHSITLEKTDEVSLEFETDRRQFIGRGRTLANPMGPSQKLNNTQGFVLDPILSLRKSLRLTPGQRIQVSMIIAAGETREEVLKLIGKFNDPPAIERAMDLTWASSQLELRLLRVQPDEARRFQMLASHLLFPNPLWRSPAEYIEENRKGQADLWAYGISGDLPIALVTISKMRDISLVRQMLQAHSYWRRHGLMVDLVVLNEESNSYEQPLRERLENLIQSHSIYTGVDQPGGIFLRNKDQIPKEDLRLIMAVARVVLVAARGTLAQQLPIPTSVPELPIPLKKKPDPRDPSGLLPYMELPYFNSLGGFTSNGGEYVIYLGPNTHTPAPWVNVIANQNFGTMISEIGSGFTWYGNSQRNRLTQWSNDPVIDPPSEAIYIRDEETGVFWTPTASPIREEMAYRARHGAGYTIFEHNSHGIEQELTVFVPMDRNGGDPIKLQRLRLLNDSARQRKLSITYYVEWVLGENRESSQERVITEWDEDAQALIARNYYHPEYGDRIAFVATNPPPVSFCGDRTSFIGRNRSLSNPAAMDRTKLSGRTGVGFDPCSALQVKIELAPGESSEITFMLGQAKSLEELHRLVTQYQEDIALENSLSQTKAEWDGILSTIEVQTPELAVDFLINRWLMYQSLSCRLWGRSAFYQSGGAIGFRDQLQDVLAFLYAYPDLAREQILLAASRQFREGDVQHWWHPPSGAGIRSRISDDLLWLPYVVARYIRVTGDVNILETKIPFLDAPILEDDQHEVFLTPEITFDVATLFEHCERAVKLGLTQGPNGLPLIGTGDWNDGMNLVGADGKGESVWLGWFLVDVLEGMAELSEIIDRSDLCQTYQQEKDSLIQRIERVSWDGKWYIRAIFDEGTPLGSSENIEARIDSIPQSWAWLSGGATKDRAEKALDSAWRHLVIENEGLVLLLEPPFDKSEPFPGYIRGYPPGVRENGGQYTHAAIWLAIAMARRGDGSRAAKIMRILNPIEHALDVNAVWRYGVEPYVISADVYRLPGRVGHGGWSWYTGSAAWMYRAWVEEILGLKVLGDQMQINPVIPSWWEAFNLRYRHGETIYEIQVENPDGFEQGVSRVEMDGQLLEDGVIPLDKDMVKHRVLVRMGQIT